MDLHHQRVKQSLDYIRVFHSSALYQLECFILNTPVFFNVQIDNQILYLRFGESTIREVLSIDLWLRYFLFGGTLPLCRRGLRKLLFNLCNLGLLRLINGRGCFLDRTTQLLATSRILWGNILWIQLILHNISFKSDHFTRNLWVKLIV